MSAKIGWSLAVVAVAGLLFLALDCGTAKPITCRGQITAAHYVPARDWTTIECHRSGRSTICLPQSHHDPEHFWATVRTPLGDGQFDDRTLYALAPNGQCTARFARGRWTGQIWGPSACELGGYWPMRSAE